MRERLVFEVADDELDDGVLTVLGLDQGDVLGAVGREREVLQLGSSSPWALRVRTRRTIRRWAPSVVSAICAMLVGG